MKRAYFLCFFSATLFAGVQQVKAEEIKSNETDTVKTRVIDEVIVTSSVKETNDLRTLPGSVSILSPQMINNRQVNAIKDINSFVPNLYIPDYGAKLTSAIYIRGIGARSSGQSVGLYVDNVPYLDKSTFDFELTDIQQIEVLRGPQGTLYGRNAMGGIINIYTLSPFNFQGTKIAVSGGNHGQFKTKISHYNKLSETLAFSIGGYYDRHDGFLRNRYTGKKADGEESAGGRFKLDWKASPNFKASYSFTYDYVDQGAFPYGKYDKETQKVSPVYLNDPSNYNRKMTSNNLVLAYQTDKFVLTSTTGYQYFKDDMKMDQDYDSLSIFILNQKQKQHAISEEIAIKSNTNSNYQWSFGIYGFYSDLHTNGPVTFKKDGIGILQEVFDNIKENNPSMPVAIAVTDEELYIPGNFKTPTYSTALFHQSTFNNLFTEGLSLTAGIRVDYEKQRFEYDAAAKMSLGVKMGNAIVQDLTPMYDETVINVKTSQDFWQALPKVSLRYQCTPRTFTYLSVAKGYKTGGYNVQQSADIMQAQMQYDVMTALASKFPIPTPEEPESIRNVVSYKPEKSWNYELGVRSELIENRLHSEFTVFYMDIRDMQLTKFVKSGNGRILSNAGKARSFGAEMSLRARFSQSLTGDINYGFTRATFRDYIYEAKQNNEIVSTDCKGNYVPYTPHHTLNIGLQYSKLLQGMWFDQFTASAQFSGVGNIYWTEVNDIYQKFYGTLNAKAGLRKGNVNMNIWSRNLTDTKYQAFYFESRNIPFIQLGKPFQIGAEIAINF